MQELEEQIEFWRIPDVEVISFFLRKRWLFDELLAGLFLNVGVHPIKYGKFYSRRW